MSTTSTITKTTKKPTTNPTVMTPPSLQQKTIDSMIGKEKEKLEMAPNAIQDMFQKIQESLLRTQEKLAENQEEMRTFHKEIKNEIGEVKEDIKTMKDKIGNIQHSITENEQRIRKAEIKIDHVELKVDVMEQKTLQLNKEMSDSLAMLEIEKASYFLRFQNIPEEKNEDLERKMVEIIAGMTQKDPKELEGQVEETYRVQTNYIRRHRLAREVHVKFSKRATRDEVYKKSREETVTYNDKEIIILKQIPRRIRNLRQQYQFLTSLLIKYKIMYRWLPIEGILITWEDKKYKIDTIEKAKEFHSTHFRLEEEQESKEEIDSRSQEEEQLETNQGKEIRENQEKEREEREGAKPKTRMETRLTKKQT